MTNTAKFGAAVATASAMVLSQMAAIPAYACEYDFCDWYGGGDTDNSVVINISNSGSISNVTTAKASTGSNWAGGSEGGDAGEGGEGGEGGDAYAGGEGGYDNWSCDDECGGYPYPQVGGGEAIGGNGGMGGNSNGGAGGAGGAVVTGDAHADAGTENALNTVEVEVSGCGCDDEGEGYVHPWFRREVDNSITVNLSNSGSISNETEAKAKTGYNDADGSEGGDADDAGNGGEGGDAEAAGGFWGWGDAGLAVGGEGGHGGESNGGAADVGGTILTGDAHSDAGTINIMNTVLVRVLR